MSKTSEGGDLHPETETLDRDFHREILESVADELAKVGEVADDAVDIFKIVGRKMKEFSEHIAGTDRDGLPISFARWTALMEDDDYRKIEQTVVDRDEHQILVSTIWIGLPPMPFETKVFSDSGKLTDEERNYYDRRYASELAAKRSHKEIVTELLLRVEPKFPYDD